VRIDLESVDNDDFSKRMYIKDRQKGYHCCEWGFVERGMSIALSDKQDTFSYLG